jgi:hypothetical protein
VSLPFDDEIKDYLRVTTDVEDFLFQELNLSAQAWLVGFYKVPVVTQARTFRGLWPRIGVQRENDTRLVIPVKPCAATATITDADATTVTSSTYLIDQRTGYVDAKRYQYFNNPPYDIAVDVGWAEHPEYEAEVEPILRQAILWAASTYYRNRNVAAIYEQSGGQVSITYTEEEIPPLLRSLMIGLKDKAWFA